MANQLDSALVIVQPGPDSTERAVEEALADALGDSGLIGFGEEVRRLRALPCEEAVRIVKDLVRTGGRSGRPPVSFRQQMAATRQF